MYIDTPTKPTLIVDGCALPIPSFQEKPSYRLILSDNPKKLEALYECTALTLSKCTCLVDILISQEVGSFSSGLEQQSVFQGDLRHLLLVGCLGRAFLNVKTPRHEYPPLPQPP